MPVRRNREISRLEGLCDAVFAFAATLLVVSLEVPRDFGALIMQMKGFAAFAVTFGVLLAIWTIHNAFFRRYALDDAWTVVLNCSLLFVVLFYVFPLKFLTESWFSTIPGFGDGGTLIAGYDELGQLFALYSTGFAALFLLISLLYWNARRQHRRLDLSPFERWEAGYLARHYLLFALVGGLSIILALLGLGVNYGLPGFIYVLLGPLCYVQGALSDRRRPMD
jgi:uncharacterized membrane protein